MDFRGVDRRYVDLKRQYDNGSLSAEVFDERLEQMMVQDDEDRWWAKSRETGEWHYYDGTTWVRDTPPRTTTVQEPQAPRREFYLSSPVSSFVDVVRRVVFQPVGFFAGLPLRGSFLNPLVFALICWEIATILSELLALVGIFGSGQDIGGFISSLIFAPIFPAIVLFIGAGILHLLVLLLVKPSNAGFEATFRVVSYASVTQLVNWIPIIGPIVAYAYVIVLSIFGIREVHATTTGRAALIVLAPFGVALLLLLLLLMLLGFALLGLSSYQEF